MNLDQSTDVSEMRNGPDLDKIKTTLEDLQTALGKLQDKCCNEEAITMMIKECNPGDLTKTFNEVLGNNTQESTSTLDANKDLSTISYSKNRSGVKYLFRAEDSLTMKITDVRLIFDDSILVKWLRPQLKSIIGYEVCVDGTLKSTVRSATRTSAVLFNLNLEKEITIEVHAVTSLGLHEISATAILRPETDS